MNKIISTCILIFIFALPLAYAEITNDCVTLDEEIKNFDKELALNSQLLTGRKQEMEKLPPEATSTKMKLTADVFMIAAKKEAAQNWLKVKHTEKSKKCPVPKYH
jgi:GTPase involved in cell partitioning and DNA repair